MAKRSEKKLKFLSIPVDRMESMTIREVAQEIGSSVEYACRLAQRYEREYVQVTGGISKRALRWMNADRAKKVAEKKRLAKAMRKGDT